MPLERPPLAELIDRVLADLSSRVVGVEGAVLRRSVLGVLGRALAGSSHELHGRLDFIARQVILDTAQSAQLERWADIWGVTRKPAEFASGALVFNGTVGAQVPAGTVAQRQDGVQYEITQAGTFTGDTLTLPVRAVEAGVLGNTPAGVTLTLQQPIAGVQAQAATASEGVSAGSDVEDDDALRARVLARIQQPPHGGAAFDYERWALEVPGVTRAWVTPAEMGLGTVTVRVVRDDDPNPIPDEPELAAVRAHIEARRPVTAEVYVVAPIPVPLDMTLQVIPDTPEVRAAIEAEVHDLLRREAVPGGVVRVSHLREAISTAPGEFDHVLVAPTQNVMLGRGEMAVPGVIAWQALP